MISSQVQHTAAHTQSARTGAPLSAIQFHPGCWPVMLTPFDAQLRIDFEALDPLVEWYLAGNCQGLFSSCLSSEMFHLTHAERLSLIGRVVKRVNGRVPVIASGAFVEGTSEKNAVGTPAALAEAAQPIADLGVDAVVFTTNQFAGPEASEGEFLKNVEATLARLDPALPLGLYECPVPYKRVLSPAAAGRLAQTGRFHFLKDTCCDLPQIREKVRALKGTPMHFYNAHTGTLLASLQAGGSGFSGVGANAIGHLYAWMCAHFDSDPKLAARLQAFFDASAPVVDDFYPYSVKYYLRLFGVPMSILSRRSDTHLPQDAKILGRFRNFHEEVAAWERQLGLRSPFSALMS